MGDTGICRVPFLVFLVVIFCSVVILEQPEARGQSSDLQTTMKFLQDKMSALDALYSTAYLTNDRGQTRQLQKVFEITSFKADAGTCHISYSLTNPNSADSEFDFDLQDVGTIEATTFEQKWQEVAAKSGHPNITETTDPSEFVVDVVLANSNQDFMFYFDDRDLANSVAKALKRAAKLCGGHDEQFSASPNVGSSAQDAESHNGKSSNVTVYNSANQPKPNALGAQYVPGVPQCTRTQWVNQGAALWIVNSCNIAVTVKLASDSGNTWGEVNVGPGSRTEVTASGIGYSPQKDGTVYLFTCPKGSQPVLPNGSSWIPRNYKGQFSCAQQ